MKVVGIKNVKLSTQHQFSSAYRIFSFLCKNLLDPPPFLESLNCSVKLDVLILAHINGNTHLYFKLDHLVFIASLGYAKGFYISFV